MADKTDYLAPLPIEKVGGFYQRLADSLARQKINDAEPFAATLLKQYLNNREPNSIYKPTIPKHIRESHYVRDVLEYQRDVFLTKKKARLGEGKGKSKEKWVGVLPRVQGLPGYTKWDMKQPIKLHYECLAEVGGTYLETVKIQLSGTPEEQDIFGSLRGFQLSSDVLISAAKMLKQNEFYFQFLEWVCQILDTYDFDYKERLTVRNPDYKSIEKNAVQPKDRDITIFHSNAKRLEEAKLAAPFKIESEKWADMTSAGPETIDITRQLS